MQEGVVCLKLNVNGRSVPAKRGMQMKEMKLFRHLIILITLLFTLLGTAVNGFADGHVYIYTGASGETGWAPPSGTPADNIVTTFKAAIARANRIGGYVVVHLRTNKLNETSPSAAIQAGVHVHVINDTGSRKAIRFKSSGMTGQNSTRMIGVNGTLTLGGEGCNAVLILRGESDGKYYYPTETWPNGMNAATVYANNANAKVLIKAAEGTVNIMNNCEVCYGKVNVWLTTNTAELNLYEGGVIHSAQDMNVNITRGTFNMYGGYIVGHYFTSGNTIPNYTTNALLDRDNYLSANFTQGGTMNYHLDRYTVKTKLEAYYPLPADPNNSSQTDPLAKINDAIAVYIHETKDANGNHLAKFNMSGGYLCGFYGSGRKDVIVDDTPSTGTYTYYVNDNGNMIRALSQPISNNGGEVNISGSAKIYANRADAAGGAFRVYSEDFDVESTTENFDHGHVTMTGGEISYCSSKNGGAARVEYGVTFSMSGGSINHCVSEPTDEQMVNPDEGGGGGSGGIRMVSSKFVMSGTAEISWCHSQTISIGQSGGAIGAVWQPGFGNVYTTVELNGGSIHHNKSCGYGGGIAVTDKGNVSVIGGIDVKIKGCAIHNNQALIDGGGIYVGGNTTVNITNSSSIYGNTAGGNGGGVLVSTTSASAPCSLDITSSEIKQNSAVNGAGVYVHEGTFNLRSGSYIHDNDATTYGGGVYMDGGEFYHYGGEIGRYYGSGGATANTAQDGAGVYMNDGTYNMSGGYNNGNKATRNGGGVYMNGGTFNLSSGSIGYGDDDYRNTASNGAGVYMANSGTFNMTGGYIRGNYATNNGGGVYMGGGTCSVTGGYIGQSTSYHNEAQYGGGIYSNAGSITIDGGDVKYNVVSQSGGGIHCYSGTVDVLSGNITNNSATLNGGGILANGTVNFSNGSINNNSAGGNGGGVSINATGALHVSGTAEMTGNNATGGYGGGVYQNGTMSIDGSALTVSGNTNGSAKAQTANNVYLPQNKTITVGNNINAESVLLGIYTENIANIGEDIPVMTGDNTVLGNIYSALVLGSSKITDDRLMHKAKFPGAATRTLYFTRVLFDHGPYSSDLPFSNPIDTQEKLYRFMCWVNGVNGYTSTHAGAVGNVTADIDMDGIQYWMPIGVSTAFTGTLTGNGHIITGLNPDLMSYSSDNYGLFGVVAAGASISDVFVTDIDITKNSNGTLGCLAGKMTGGTIKNCEGAGSLESNQSTCIIGGLVGQMTGGTVHSSCAMADMTGYQMGGLVGDLASGCSLYNSFANASFSPQSGSTKYMGGLVGVNKGTVENCYSRVRGTVPGATYFGWLAGDNTSGTLNSSYIPTAYSNYTATSKTGTQNNLNKYAPVIAPYLYNRAGDNAVGSSTLLAMLDNWARTHDGYASWKRTTAGAYSAGAGNINGDYPVHKYTDYKCVASTDGIVLDYAANLDAMLTRHTSDATVNLYAHDNTSKGTGNNVMVYIDENISLLQSTSNAITAYTCQTLPGSTRSWHFLSSSLTNSGIGFNYGTSSQVPFSWAENPCNVTFSATDDQALYPHDVPNINLVDLYCFYEPEYHWMNLKRNSNSHWHMNATTVPITYTNETTLTPGKGYLVSIAQDQLLQNKGTLNNGNVTIHLDYTPAQAWAGLVGYNLIGNPYQSYLDFSTLASKNMSLWAEKGCEPTYAVYDAEMGGYIQYKEGTSRGAKAADGIINMHQGFMVRTASATDVIFTNDMRTNDGTTTGIRGEQPAYPLINLTVTDDEGVNDFAVLELGRENNEGAEKLRANDSKGWLYLRHEGESYGILFRTEVEDYQPLWFEAEEEGSYTLSWETANAEFEALTLVDNITGAITDMLTNDSYTFEANPDQYSSRFKIMIGDWKDVDEFEDPEPVEGPTFAYYANGEIHLAETCHGASLQIIDVTGRIIVSRDEARHVSTNGIAPGVYLLRLTDGKETKTQKIVIE